jgi:hypothetical protein
VFVKVGNVKISHDFLTSTLYYSWFPGEREAKLKEKGQMVCGQVDGHLDLLLLYNSSLLQPVSCFRNVPEKKQTLVFILVYPPAPVWPPDTLVVILHSAAELI